MFHAQLKKPFHKYDDDDNTVANQQHQPIRFIQPIQLTNFIIFIVYIYAHAFELFHGIILA